MPFDRLETTSSVHITSMLSALNVIKVKEEQEQIAMWCCSDFIDHKELKFILHHLLLLYPADKKKKSLNAFSFRESIAPKQNNKKCVKL